MAALVSRLQVSLIAASFSVVLLFVIAFYSFGYSPQPFDRPMDRRREIPYSFAFGRKLLAQVQNAGATVPSTTEVNNGTAATKPNRIGEGCSPGDLVLYQAATTPLPSGIPTYTVQILNECLGGGDCRIGHIHLSCGWFSSARLVNPRVFRRLRFNDCLVNDGRPIANGQSISFQYANTFRYPLSVSSATCLSSTSTSTSP